MSYINYLDLPILPTNIEINILETVKNKSIDLSGKKILINTDTKTLEKIGTVDIGSSNIGFHYSQSKKYFPNIVDYDFIEPTQLVKDWVDNNIPFSCIPYIQVMSNGECVPPHIDESRSKAVNYLLETGGNATTTFYKPKKEFNNLDITPQIVIPYDRLIITESQIIKDRCWHELIVTKIHGVENLSSNRISLTLCL